MANARLHPPKSLLHNKVQETLDAFSLLKQREAGEAELTSEMEGHNAELTVAANILLKAVRRETGRTDSIQMAQYHLVKRLFSSGVDLVKANLFACPCHTLLLATQVTGDHTAEQKELLFMVRTPDQHSMRTWQHAISSPPRLPHGPTRSTQENDQYATEFREKTARKLFQFKDPMDQ